MNRVILTFALLSDSTSPMPLPSPAVQPLPSASPSLALKLLAPPPSPHPLPLPSSPPPVQTPSPPLFELAPIQAVSLLPLAAVTVPIATAALVVAGVAQFLFDAVTREAAGTASSGHLPRRSLHCAELRHWPRNCYRS